jgi:RHS repeat-associated protein
MWRHVYAAVRRTVARLRIVPPGDNRRRRVVLIEALAALGVAAFVVFALGGPFSPFTAAGAAGGRSEVIHLRTAMSTTYDNGDGTFTTELSSSPVHFRNSAGWHDIDPTLVSSTSPGYRWVNKAAAFKAQFKDHVGDGLVRFQSGSAALSMEPMQAAAAVGVASGNGVDYAGAFPGVGLHYQVQSTGVKETLTLASAKAPTSYEFLVRADGVADLQAGRRPDGSWTLFSQTSGTRLTLLSPTAADAAASPRSPAGREEPVSLSITPGKAGLLVHLDVDPTWLHAKARRFPVTIDPTITIGDGNDAESFRTTCPSCGPKDWEERELYVGADNQGAVWRDALQFDLGDIPPGVQISTASVKLWYTNYQFNWTNAQRTLHLYPMTRQWTAASTESQLAFDGSTDIGQPVTFTPTSTRWLVWDATSTIKNWYLGLKPNYGLLVKDASEQGDGVRLASTEYPEPSVRPQLSITWTGDGVDLLKPTVLHSNGAELSWSHYSNSASAPFQSYKVYRSLDRRFTPSEDTLLATITDPNTTTYRDTTAAPDTAFTYEILTNGTEPSGEQTVTLPKAGQASAALQPGSEGTMTYMDLGWGSCGHGSEDHAFVGRSNGVLLRPLVQFVLPPLPTGTHVDSATMSFFHTWSAPSYPTHVRLHAVTAGWDEGGSGCGANWNDSSPGTPWQHAGGDFESVPSAQVKHGQWDFPGWDAFDVTSLAQRWISTTLPNHGATLVADFPSYDTVVKSDGPKAYWRLGEPQGATTAVDGSGNGDNATYVQPALGEPGAISRDSDTAARLNDTLGPHGSQTPANDNFAAAQVISGPNGSIDGANINAGAETGEPNHANGTPNGGTAGHSVWYSWTAPTTGTVTMNTVGSDFDTELAVYTGSSLSTLTNVARDDDSGGYWKSVVHFSATSGTTYLVAIDDWGESGYLSLRWSLPVTGVPNDAFGSATALTGTNPTAFSTNTGATKEAGEPNHAGNAGGHSVWFTYTATKNERMTLDTAGSGYDTTLAVYTGTAVNALTQVAQNDDYYGQQSWVEIDAIAGQQYRVAVDGWNGATGQIVVNVQHETSWIDAGDQFDFAGQHPYTLEAWIKPTMTDNIYRMIFWKSAWVNNQREGYTAYYQNGTLAFERFQGGTRNAIGAPFHPDGAWHHVAFVYDGTTQRVYLDGSLVTSGPSTIAQADTTEKLTIGSTSWGSQMVAGAIDEAAVYDKALTDDQVWSHYDAGVKTDDSIQYWTDDYVQAPTLRPKLSLTYDDSSQAIAPTVRVSSPAPGQVAGQVTLAVSASDDRRVDGVTFRVDGKAVATDTQAPFTSTWDSSTVPNGTHAISAEATDDATNSALSPDVTVTVGNSAPPKVSVQVAANAPYATQVRNDRPVAYWRLGDSTTTAVDASPNGNNGTYRGSVTRGVTGAISGDADKAATFPGSYGSDVQVTDRAAFSFGTGSFSVETWVKSGAVTGWKDIVTKSPGSGAGWGVSISSNSDTLGQIDVWARSASGAVTDAYGPSIRVDDNAWHHVAGVYDRTANQIIVWVDGTPATTPITLTGTFDNTTALRIGDGDHDPAFAGSVDDTALYNTALSSDQVRAHYRAGTRTARATYADAVKQSSPSAYWRFGEPRTAGLAIDSSGYGLDGHYLYHTEKGIPGALAHDANTAIRLHGVSDDCGIAFQTAFVDDPDQLDAGRDDFSIEIWVRTSRNGEEAVVSKVPDSGAGWWMTVTDDGGMVGRIRVKTQDASNNVTAYYGPNLRVDDNRWHHVVAVFQRSYGLHIYVDGVGADTATPVPGDMTDGAPLLIGSADDYAPFLGDVDEPAYYRKALSPLRVKAHYTAGVQGTNYSKQVLQDAPRGYWRLGESATSAQAADASGNGVTAEYQNVDPGATGAIAVDSNTAVHFQNQVADYVHDRRADFVNAGDTFDFAGQQSFSVEAWIKPDKQSGAFGRIVSKEDSDASARREGWSLWVYPVGNGNQYRLGFERWRDGAGDGLSASSFQWGVWAYVVAVYDGVAGQMSIYVNGTLVSRGTATAQVLDNARPFEIGNSDWSSGPGSQFLGDMDEVAIYSRALPPTDIAKHYDAGAGEGLPVSGTVTVTAATTDDSPLDQVELYVDGKKLTDQTAPPNTSSWTPTFSWNTLSAAAPAFDGVHVLTTRAHDKDGNMTTSAPERVTVANTADTRFRAGIVGTPTPDGMTYDSSASTQASYAFDVTLTNTSSVTWAANATKIGYRWLNADGSLSSSGFATTVASAIAPGQSTTATVTVPPPTLATGVDRGQYTLQVDAADASGNWYAVKGNTPISGLVTVTRATPVGLGLERFWHYDGDDLGGGVQHLVNLASGNSLLRWTPFDSPGRGLSTVVDFTYNSSDSSSGPLGVGWSVSLSTLNRVGTPLQLSGSDVILTDGDGTQHTFKATGTGYAEPPGVHLYLRRNGTGWAFTRPDRVTFYYDATGKPTTVVDRNGNRLLFTYDASGKLTGVTDAAGKDATDTARTFVIDYYAVGDCAPAAAIGKIESITDHSDPNRTDNGSSLSFTYNANGELTNVTQEAGTNADGSYLAERNFDFDYVASPDGVRRLGDFTDPRSGTSSFVYTSTGRLFSRTNRGNQDTIYAYDTNNRVTTVETPGHTNPSTYTFTTGGLVTKIVNGLNQTSRIEWDANRQVDKVVEPTGAYTDYAYDDNGYLTDTWDQLRNHTQLQYDYLQVDSGDTSSSWAAGRTQPHISQLVSKTDPKGTATASVAGDYLWQFKYDDKGNPTESIDPLGFHTYETWSDNGTLAATTDANGHKTSYSAYDANGLPQEIVEANGNTTFMTYDVDGLLRTVQDPNHATESGGTWDQSRNYRAIFDYDTFHRLGRQSAPKNHQSGNLGPETLMWTSADYDPNDNVVAEYAPAYGSPGFVRGTKSTHVYDALDRLSQDQDVPLQTGTFQLAGVTSSSSGTTVSVDSAAQLYEGDIVDVLANGQPVAGGANREIASVDRTANTVTFTGSTGVSAAAGNTVNENQTTRTDLSSPRIANYTYDAADRLIAVTRPGVANSSTPSDFTMRYAYDDLDRVAQQIAGGAVPPASDPSDARVTRYCYDLAGDLRSVTPPASTNFTGCPAASTAGSAYSPTMATGTVTYRYDAAHQLVGQTDPLGHDQSLTYDANGNVDTTTDENGVKASRTYDQRGQVIKAVTPFTVDSSGKTTRSLTSQYEYDGVGNLLREISPRAYDASSDKQRFSDYVTSYVYDTTDRLIRVDLPANSSSVATHIHYGYDGNDNMIWATQPTDQIDPSAIDSATRTNVAYYDTGWVKSTDDPTKGPVNFDYTAEGWQSMRTPRFQGQDGTWQDGPVQRWVYYPDGSLQQDFDNYGDPNIYRYDLNGNLVSMRDASGLQRPGQTAIDVLNQYDRFAEPTQTKQRLKPNDVWHQTDSTYDANGNVLTETDENGTPAQRTNTFAYDAANKLTYHVDLPGSGTTDCTGGIRQEYRYDKAGQTTDEVDRTNNGSACSNGAAWPVTQAQRTDYNADGSPSAEKTWAAASLPEPFAGLAYDAPMANLLETHNLNYMDNNGNYLNGNKTFDSFSLKNPDDTNNTCWSPDATKTCTASYTYDPQERLTSWYNGLPSGHGSQTINYTLDATGNITRQQTTGDTSSTQVFDYSPGGQLVDQKDGSGNTTELFYYTKSSNPDEGNGNLKCVAKPNVSYTDCVNGQTNPDVLQWYAYDKLDRLGNARQNLASGSFDKSVYTYDAFDRVAWQDDSFGRSGMSPIGRVTDFSYMGASTQVSSERQWSGDGDPSTDDSANIGQQAEAQGSKTYSYDAYLSRVGMQVSPQGGATQSYSYGNNDHGDVSLLVGQAGAAKASYGYTPYGAEDPGLTSSSDSTKQQAGGFTGINPTNNYRFNDFRFDPASGSIDMGARRFSPDTSRFIQDDFYNDALGDLALGTDPITGNRYEFGGANPINFVELDGHLFGIGCKLCKKAGHYAKTAVHVAEQGYRYAKKGVEYCTGRGAGTCAAVAGGVALMATGVGAVAGGGLAAGALATATAASAASSAFSVAEYHRTGSKLALVNAALGAVDAGGLATAARASYRTAQLSRRASELHGHLATGIERGRGTTAVLRGKDAAGNEVRIIGKSGRRPTPAQRSSFRDNEMAAPGRTGRHAEESALIEAEKRGVRPLEVAASRDICPQCAMLIRRAGARTAGRVEGEPRWWNPFWARRSR